MSQLKDTTQTIYIACYQKPSTRLNQSNQIAKFGYYNLKTAVLNLGVGGCLYELKVPISELNYTPSSAYVLMKKNIDPDVFPQPIDITFVKTRFDEKFKPYKIKKLRVDKIQIIL